MAEEKQIESAAIKFEYRKVQELKESLASENAYLKSLLNNANALQNAANNLNNSSSALNTAINTSSSPSSNYNSPRVLSKSSLAANPNTNLNSNSLAVSSSSSLCSTTTTPLINTSNSNLANATQMQGKFVYVFFINLSFYGKYFASTFEMFSQSK